MINVQKLIISLFAVFIILGNALAQDQCQVNFSRTFAINVLDNGAFGDGLTDDTKALQNAIDQASAVVGKVIIPDGIYLVDAVKGLQVKSGVLLDLSKNAILKAAPNNNDNYSILRVKNAANVTIVGGILLGERYEHKGLSGEWGMGLSLDGASNVVIKNIVSKDNWGDGFYVGGDSRNINFCSVVADSNRRQGMSIVFGSDIFITKSSFVNTKGIAPEAGIDIEPNNNQTVRNVKITHSQFINNNGSGIASYAKPDTMQPSIVEIEISENNVLKNKRSGIILINTKYFSLVKNTIEDNGANAIFLDKKTLGGIIKQNYIKVRENFKNNRIVDNGANSVFDNFLH